MENDNSVTTEKAMPVPEWSTVPLQSFEELLAEFEAGRPAKMYIPVSPVEEQVSVKIYAPGEEKEEPVRKSRRERRQKRRQRRKEAAKKPLNPRGAVTAAVFILLFLFTAVLNLITPDAEYSQTENRSLASFPSLSASAVMNGTFSEDFEKYLSDHFALRDNIVSFRSFFSRLMGAREQNNVYIGKNGRLFQKQTPYKEAQVKKITDAIRSFTQRTKIKSTMLMLVPDSSFILSEELPALLGVDSQKQQIASIVSRLPKGMKSPDVTEDFLSCDKKDELYYRTDHHWTTYGAKRAFNLLAEQWKLKTSGVKYKFYTVSNDFYGTLSSSSGISERADSVSVCVPENSAGTYVVTNKATKTKTTTLFDLSKLQNKNKYEVFLGGNFSQVNISTVNRNGKALLMFKDSYANCLLPMLTPYFERIVVIDPRYFTSDIDKLLKEEKFTHLLFLYNLHTFLSDTSLADALS